jgi:hypothetical protein
MNLSTLDVLILIPLIPLGLVAFTWGWIPWDKVFDLASDQPPKWFLGLYLLYASFAAFHFKQKRWTVSLIASIGIVFVFVAVHDRVKNSKHS